MKEVKAKIQVTRNGPYIVSGALPLSEQWIATNADGESLDYSEGTKYPEQQQYALCRCGQSANKPFCDGTHAKVHFDGTETAGHEPYLEHLENFEGPTTRLTDKKDLCAFARFCDPKGQIWNLVGQSGNPEAQQLVQQQAGDCPGGRLVAWNRETGEPLEPEFEPSIGLIEDTAKKVMGPIWVRGGVPVVSAAEEPYEIRNRVALCRCGRSANKPFCDGSHAG